MLRPLSLSFLLLFVFLTGCETEPVEPLPAADTTAVGPDLASALEQAEQRRAEIGPAREPLDLRFPTGNDALFRDKSAFFAALDLDRIPGLREYGWEGGQYGYVRNPAKGSRGMIFSRPHEGLDIKPLYFDARGEPADTVRAIADGRVVYANRGRGSSSYGQYVVVEHEWDGAPVYSLYAHLERVDVNEEDSVAAGDPLGRLGYTGRGTARHRAHVHLEVNLLLNEHFKPFFDAFYGSRNAHGIYFGRNLAGLDVEALYRVHRNNPTFSFREFVRRRPLAYRIAIPGTYPLDLLRRYPWLADGVDGAGQQRGVGRGVHPRGRAGGGQAAGGVRRCAGGGVGGGSDRAGSPCHERHAGSRRQHLSPHARGKAAAALLATSERGVPPWF